ncbi:hypothetical protein AOL_s00078g567 [Orbilia oligospora ATCC 24927]|uniref:Copper acquisition factor BIM1-like domain-containing protein n=1 Tax=Arthrobotrys oligospora (strain ATCC 24927 / CBS 115.81 / DSM 1491) TaxID=756982 RepID=G1XCC0_ARTOA|nr:hypothetical protein AOL_s00078g567 [Orbilia oligospora ATCC 24927]EGX49183.1 hypothetical protein AOL_s00078g567 [Orbilia oligospora ATCC 24927]
MFLKSCLLLPLLPFAAAHFLLNTPPTIGFSDDEEGTYPCGSFNVTDRKTVTDFPIVGIPISVTSTHPEDTWFFRVALLNDTENWVDLLPAISQQGTGDFCNPSVPGPAAWEGEDGVLQIVASAPDGYLFQCAAVKFVGGSASTTGTCKNGTKVNAEFIDEKLVLNAQTTSTAGGSEATEMATKTGGPATQTSASGSTTTPNAADRRDGGFAILGGIVGVFGLLFI